MGLLDKFKRKAETTFAESRLEEELMYKHAFREMNAGLIREGLYAKALAKNSGNEEQTKSLYLDYRVQSIKDELKGMSYAEHMAAITYKVRKMNKRQLVSFAKQKGIPVDDTDTMAIIKTKLQVN